MGYIFEQDDDSDYAGGFIDRGLDSPTDFDEHVMNEDECTEPGDNAEEYYSDDDGQPDEAQQWHDFDPDC